MKDGKITTHPLEAEVKFYLFTPLLSKTSCGYLYNMSTCLLYSSPFPESPRWFTSCRDPVHPC